MPYALKVFLYASLWCMTGSAVGFQLLSDSNFFIVFGVALLMAVVAVLLGRWLFGREGCRSGMHSMRVVGTDPIPFRRIIWMNKQWNSKT